MTTTIRSRRRPRGVNPKGSALQQSPEAKGFTLPGYLEQPEVNALIAAAPNPQARLLILVQWRAGLRISEALALEARDLHLDTDRRGSGKSADATAGNTVIGSTILISTYAGTYLPGNHAIELLEAGTGTQFTTGDNQHGYLLTKVTHAIQLDSPSTEIVGVTVNANNAGSPGTELYAFPDQTITTTIVQTVTHVGEFLLEPNRKYWILITKGAGSATSLQVYYKSSNDVATGLADWTLSSGSTDYYEGAWHNDSHSYSIRLEGIVQPPTILISNYTGTYNPGTESRLLSRNATHFTTGKANSDTSSQR